MDHAKNDKNHRQYRLSKKGIWYREQNQIRKERAKNKDKYIRRDERAMNKYTISVNEESEESNAEEKLWNAWKEWESRQYCDDDYW